ncbi:LptF/LptG family permease [Romeria aff. gracilis LEGE 07310]|uniref:LptF/LptG family permease n=1 Tax=Vasconcelosia minhoensis LEGE 07310 TaxID=915328 RepID=A0A8J7AS80_9CYAN|nr:LptF/LptG family permease [Romeria gracilis]MBE9079726.1 LptF/LptG family permease [Romeria aff. gracilis LEGE 07310]
MTDSAPAPRPSWPSWLPQLSILDRYIIQELSLPFLFGVGAFSSIGVSIGALFELIRRVSESGLALSLAVEIFALRLPEFVVLAFPMSTLLATMMTFSRFSSDSELVALRGCGVSVRRIIAPALVMSLMVTGLSFVFNEVITPAANYRASVRLDRALNTERPPFQERNIKYEEYQPASDGSGKELARLFYARKFNGEEMQELTVLDFSQGDLEQIVSADSATWDFKQNLWRFSDGTIYAVSPNGSFSQVVKFNQQALQLPRTPLDLAARTKDDSEMNIAEASRYLETLQQTGDERKIRTLKVRIQQKYAIPFACIVFGLVGSAIGIRPQRTGRATSFGISVAIIFGFYLLTFITNAMGQSGVLSPFVGAWLPLGIGLIAGLFLVYQVSK